MAESKHTPGPWTYDPEWPGIFAGGECIFELQSSCGGGESAEPNCKLIAAAPDLLDALRGAVEWMACVEGHLRDGQPFRRNLADYQAAIAKAEGRVD